MERHVPELYDWVQKNNEAAPEMRCAILDVISWFPGVLQQLWIDVETRSGCSCWENGENEALWNGHAIVGLRDLWEMGGEGTKLLRDLVTTAAANGQCSPHAVGRWTTQLERVLLPPLLLAELSVHSFCLFGGVCRATLMCRFV